MPNGFESVGDWLGAAAPPWSGLFFASNAAKSGPGTLNEPKASESRPKAFPAGPNGLAPVAGSGAVSMLSTAGMPWKNVTAAGPAPETPLGPAVDGIPVTIRRTPPCRSIAATEPLVPKQACPSGPWTHLPFPPTPASATYSLPSWKVRCLGLFSPVATVWRPLCAASATGAATTTAAADAASTAARSVLCTRLDIFQPLSARPAQCSTSDG